ncbi:MAG TPA: alkaline phosphatase family protein, partial [Anaerolineales bacterium]|nr:alkaline phosphatase family protein [Anaerolineales bacterium]
QILPRLQQYRLAGFDLGAEFIYPQYDGLSILNIPDSVCRLLGAPALAHGALRPELLEHLGTETRKVIVVLVDALALHRLQRWLAQGDLPAWEALSSVGVLAPLTSITPSTTSAALTSLWTGRSAAEHGIVGYEMWMKEYGVVANTILHAPILFKGDVGSLAKAGFEADKYLPWPTMGAHLAAHGISTYVLQHSSILDSGLSRMFFHQAKTSAFSTAAEMWVNLRRLLEKKKDERFYSWVYWGAVDHFAHHYGPDDERGQAEFISFSRDFATFFLDKLSAAARAGATVIHTAHHGAIHTPLNPHYELSHHPNLVRRLHIFPTGENRLAYFFIRPGQTEAVYEYLERTWPNQFTLVDPLFAVEHGLFGPGEPHPRLLDRLGELMVIARGQSFLWWSPAKENFLLGRHGGLNPQEMLVPFLAARLDAL